MLLRSLGEHFAENPLLLVEDMFCNNSIKAFPRQETLSRSAELPLEMQLLPRELWVSEEETLRPKTQGSLSFHGQLSWSAAKG